MVQEIFEDFVVAVFRHKLVFILKIAIVVAEDNGNAIDDGSIDLVDGSAPLLGGVVNKNFVVDEITKFLDERIAAGDEVIDGNFGLVWISGSEFLLDFGGFVGGEEELDGFEVEGDGDELVVDEAEYTVLIEEEIGEVLEIIENAAAIGVENVGAIEVNADVVGAFGFVHIAANVRAFF